MHPVNLIACGLLHDDPDYPPTDDLNITTGVCAITGIEDQCVPRKKLLGKSFRDGDTLSAPDSDMVSLGAYVALKYKWERMSSWVCDGVFKKLNRIEVRNAVLTGNHKTPWCGYATTSYKKHGSLRAPINYSQGQNKWLFESRVVDCSDSATMLDWWEILNVALRSGIGRSVMKSLDCPSSVMRKVGLQKWMVFEKWAKPKSNSAMYAFLVYLLPSQEELNNE